MPIVRRGATAMAGSNPVSVGGRWAAGGLSRGGKDAREVPEKCWISDFCLRLLIDFC